MFLESPIQLSVHTEAPFKQQKDVKMPYIVLLLTEQIFSLTKRSCLMKTQLTELNRTMRE